MNDFTITDAILSIDNEAVDKNAVAVLVEQKVQQQLEEVGRTKYREGKESQKKSDKRFEKLACHLLWSAMGLVGVGAIWGFIVCLIHINEAPELLERKEMDACSKGIYTDCLSGWSRNVESHYHYDNDKTVVEVLPRAKAYESAYFLATGKQLIDRR